MIQLEAHGQACATATASLKTRANLAIHHLLAACRLTVRIGEIETANAGQPYGDFGDEILQNALGVATLTVAALESYANEMYFEGGALKPGLSAAAATEIASLIDKESVVRKYALALAVSTGKRLDLGIDQVQNVQALIALRNAVVHFRPEWSDEQDKHEKLSKQLNYRFSPSTFLPQDPVFPRAWASHSFAVWSLRSAVKFLDHFYSELGQPSILDPFRSQLSMRSGEALP